MTEKISMRFRVWKSGNQYMWEVINSHGRRLAGSGATDTVKFTNWDGAANDARKWIEEHNGTISDYE